MNVAESCDRSVAATGGRVSPEAPGETRRIIFRSPLVAFPTAWEAVMPSTCSWTYKLEEKKREREFTSACCVKHTFMAVFVNYETFN